VDRYLIPRLDPYLPDLSDPPPETKPSPVPTRQVFRSNLDVFSRLVRSIHDQNIPVLVVHTPNRGEVAVPGGSASPNPYRQQFIQRAESLDVPVLNLASAWRGMSNVSSYYRDHVHLNENGNEALADTLPSFLNRNLRTLCSR
jgi:lysophospholipase L1-like esterase